MVLSAALLALAASLAVASAETAPSAPSPTPAPEGPAATPPPEEPPPSAEKPPIPRGSVLEEVSGTVREIDRKAYKVEVDTSSGPVTLSLDRNTMVYTASGLATVLDVNPGTQIRAGRNADFLAYWVQVRTPAKTEPPSTPAQGTGPAGGGGASVPPGEASGAAGGATPPAGTAPGGTAPGATPAP
jgi:hypothetical protein